MTTTLRVFDSRFTIDEAGPADSLVLSDAFSVEKAAGVATVGLEFGAITPTSVTTDGDVTCDNVIATADVGCATVTATGACTAGSVVATGGDVGCATVTATGAIQGASCTCTAAVQGLTVVSTSTASVAGIATVGGLIIPVGATLTIASGAVTATKSSHLIDSEAAAASDDLDTINGGTAGQILILGCVNAAHDIVVKHNTGNIELAGGVDMTLGAVDDTITLFFRGTKWCELCRAINHA